jgi:hypothetical protein
MTSIIPAQYDGKIDERARRPRPAPKDVTPKPSRPSLAAPIEPPVDSADLPIPDCLRQ